MKYRGTSSVVKLQVHEVQVVHFGHEQAKSIINKQLNPSNQKVMSSCCSPVRAGIHVLSFFGESANREKMARGSIGMNR
jgi:hypothetical protein